MTRDIYEWLNCKDKIDPHGKALYIYLIQGHARKLWLKWYRQQINIKIKSCAMQLKSNSK